MSNTLQPDKEMKNRKEENDKFDKLKDKLPDGDGFIAPEGYFEQLPSRIIEKVRSEKLHNTSTISAYRILIPLAAAASLILFFAIYYQNQQVKPPVQTSSVADSISIETAIDESYVNDILTEDFQQADILIEQWGDETESSFAEQPIINEDITEESIIEYLNDQELDPTLLAEL